MQSLAFLKKSLSFEENGGQIQGSLLVHECKVSTMYLLAQPGIAFLSMPGDHGMNIFFHPRVQVSSIVFSCDLEF